jgi:hypothetical protein
VSDTPPTSPSDPGGWLRARVAELEADNARLRQAAADRDERAAAQLAAERARAGSLAAQVAALAARVEELQRLLGKDSSTSSKPPSSDSPYKSVGLGGVGFPRNLGCGAGAGSHGPVLTAGGLSVRWPEP